MTVQLWRMRYKTPGGFRYKFFKGKRPNAKAELAGEFKRLYDPITGRDCEDYSYQEKGGPQPDYYSLIMMYPK